MGTKLTQKEVEERIRETFVQDISVISVYSSRREPIKLHCNECQYEWMVKNSANVLYLNKGSIHHHCPNCGERGRRTGKYFNCAYCGEEVYRNNREIKNNKTQFYYCSRSCGNNHKNQLRRESGEWDNSKDYRKQALKTYSHECACCGYNEDERILQVHHKDSNRENNDIGNLIILCPNCHWKITLGYYELIFKDSRYQLLDIT